ncbi:MAG: MFS transporter, partial [Sphingobacteriales bacterium]
VAGMGGTSAVIGTIIITLLVPVLTKTNYTSFFLLGAVLVPVAWMCITFITSKKEQNAIT